ncbi:MAG: glycoside hydrolase family 15 protein [Planctomycetota bacterium]|nr:glycoside hydrolase family 15 protein [Planctomycetota bacterium]
MRVSLALSASCSVVALLHAAAAFAQPALVSHNPASQVFNQPAGVTGREPEVVRENEATDIWMKIGPSFTYNRVFIYYTTDGTPPSGANGVPGNPSTRVLASFSQNGNPASISFQYNQPNGFGGNDDWWKATIPSTAGERDYNRQIRYLISAQQNAGGQEIFANNSTIFSYTNRLAWPGAGAGQPQPQLGYPPVSFWKEEGFIGNQFTAAMLDQNATWWDMYFPTPGGVQGVGSRNEGYSDGADTFPPLLTSEKRGQMHLNQAMVGIRTLNDNLTHWLSNPNGVSYTGVNQAYAGDETNTLRTSQTLSAGGNNISVTQFDFAPAGIDFPDGLNNTGEQKHILVKRMILRNNAATTQDVNVYLYVDPALNGGDTYDVMFFDAARGAMTAYDKTRRTVTGTGAFITPPEEYNITTFPGYDKNIALYLTSAMNVVPGAGHPNSGPATDSWRDTSGDQGQGWIGKRVTLPPGVDVEVSFMLAGAHFRPDPITNPIPANDGVYDNELVPTLDWFYSSSPGAIQNATDQHWTNWLAGGTTIDTPNDEFDRLMKRGLLATALHQDAVHGAVVAGYHNGAYYYAWPRDAMWAAVTLLRTGHVPEGLNAIRWMRDITFRDVEPSFGINPVNGQATRGFWKQKYTTDGFTVWGAPQIDGTAVYPWALMWYYDMTGDTGTLNSHYAAVWDAVQAMTRDSIDNRLRFEESVNLVYSNNLWEDQYDVFVYSNANVVRGIRDAARIARILGRNSDANGFEGNANGIQAGLNARLDWNGENTDASQLGIVYPFETHSPVDPRSVRVIDRINGVASDRFGNVRPLVNFAGFFSDGQGWTDLINRYWGDGYWGNGSASSPWGAGPWFLTTMWYGVYYALRQDFTPGTGDIDNHTYRLNLLIDRLGPVGLGAEQIAPRGIPGQPAPRNVGSLMYPGQNDFVLQTAWPNAWESMSFFVDSLMAYLDYRPQAATSTINVEPKLPSAWPAMTFNNVEVGSSSFDVTIARDDVAGRYTQAFTNNSVNNLTINTAIRVPANATLTRVTANGCPVPHTYNAALGRIDVTNLAFPGGVGEVVELVAFTGCAADFNQDGTGDFFDYLDFVVAFDTEDCTADVNADGTIDFFDYLDFAAAFDASC